MVHLTRVGAGAPAVVPAFLLARAARLYPLWWLCLGAISLVWLVRPAWVFATITDVPNFPADIALWPHRHQPLLAVGWTLVHEVYFYLVFGGLLLLPRRWLPLGLLGWMALVTLGHLLAGPLDQEHNPVLALVTHPVTLEFGMGAAAGLLAAGGVRPAPRLLIAAGGLLALAAVWLLFALPVDMLLNHWTRVATIGPAGTLITLGLVGLETDRLCVPLRPLGGLGDVSYAFYLVHIPVFNAIARVAAPFCGPAAWDNLLLWGVSLVIAAIAAAVLHRGFERPVLHALTRLRVRWMPRGSALLPSPPPPLAPRPDRLATLARGAHCTTGHDGETSTRRHTG